MRAAATKTRLVRPGAAKLPICSDRKVNWLREGAASQCPLHGVDRLLELTTCALSVM